MTDLPHDLTLQKMMMGCPEWLDPLYSPFRKSNVDTAWLRLVRDVHIHIVWTSAYSSSIIFVSFTHSKRVGSDSRKNGDLQHRPWYWPVHSHTNGPQWVGCIHCLVFVWFIQKRTKMFTVSLQTDQRSESRTPQRVSIKMCRLMFLTSLGWNLCFLCDRGKKSSLYLQHPTGWGRE